MGTHLELFAERRVIVVPAGIGVPRPHRRAGAYVRGACSYPLHTREPTGVVELAPGLRATLGDLFDLWGRPLSRTPLLGFAGPVSACLRP